MGKARELTPWWVTIGARCPEAVRIVNRLHSLGVHVLFDAAKAARKEELKALYKQRWAVELDIRHIKETMGMNILSCKTPDMALKEVWVYLLAYNLSRLIMAQSAFTADIMPRGYQLQALFTAVANVEPASRYI